MVFSHTNRLSWVKVGSYETFSDTLLADHPNKVVNRLLLTVQIPVITVCTIRFNVRNLYTGLTGGICVFCTVLITDDEYFPTLYKLH